MISVIILTMLRDRDMLIRNLHALRGAKNIDNVLVVWNPSNPPPSNLTLPDIGVPVLVSYII